jgi:hypothetical protein
MNPVVTLLLIAMGPAIASAQNVVGSWPGLDPSRLSTVYVVDDTGTETEGRLLRLDPDALVLLVDSTERRFEAARVKRIQRRGDSLKNGAIIGAVVGGVMGALAAGISDCPSFDGSDGCPGTRVGLFFFSVGVYSAIGTAIDALIPGRTTIYPTPRAP